MEVEPNKVGPRSMNVIKRDHKVISPSMTRDYNFVYRKAKGCYIWDEDGKKHLDFAAGISVMNVGHSNPEVVSAIKKQIAFGSHCAFPDFYAKLPVDFAEKLIAVMPPGLNKVFFSNSGTESVECAYKLARWHSQKKWTVAFDHCFHGRTMGSLSMTCSKPVQRERYDPFLPVIHVPYPYYYRMKMDPEECSQHCLIEIEKVFEKYQGDTASLFLEPIQGEGGYIVPPVSFVRGVRKLCDKYGVLLCDDEVQAGYFRTGKFLAISNFNVKPDIVSMSKALGSGIPFGATVASSGVMDWVKSAHSNTFGGNLVACASALASLEYAKKKKLGQNAVKVGSMMLKKLEEMKEKYEFIGDVRGMGLMIGIEMVKDKKTRDPGIAEREFVLYRAAEKGLVLLGAGTSVIRICPPLIITKEQATAGLDILDAAFHMLHHQN